MPKRSNDFQKLVAAVKKALGQGAIVRESEMLPDRLTGALREVDVYIEAIVAGHKVTVCVECVDEDRAASVAWVDEMAAKHQSLPTNRLVLAARKGFTKEALAKAEKLGIEILNYERLDPSSVEALFGGASSLWSKVFSVTPQKVVVHIPAAGVLRGRGRCRSRHDSLQSQRKADGHCSRVGPRRFENKRDKRRVFEAGRSKPQIVRIRIRTP
jgi:hypothetical protein